MSLSDLTRRDVLRAGVGSSAALFLRPGRGRRGGERPNLLIVCSDQQHWRALGFADPFFSSPNIDRLAADACVFRQAYCSSPQCSPSRSSMLTGFYPHKAGVMNNVGSPGAGDLAYPHMGALLQAAGYHTVYLGKWHLGAGEMALGGWDEEAKNVGDKRITELAEKFLARSGELDKPFALVLMYLDPHNIQKFKPPKVPKEVEEDVPLDETWEREELRDKPPVQAYFVENFGTNKMKGQPRSAWEEFRLEYRERVEILDGRIGTILDTLRAIGQWENTATFVTSDHGEMDTHHRMIFKGPVMYEHLVRIPMIARIPDSLGGRPATLDHYAWMNVDLLPTVLDLAGAEPLVCDGRSAVPLLQGESLEERPFVISQYYGKKGWLSPIRMLRTPRFKYVLYIEHGEELYDLEQDPNELTNLAGDEAYAEKKAELRSRLEEWITANQDPFFSLQASALSARKSSRFPR